MIARKPDIWTSDPKLIWSRIPEFAIFYNASSAVIPYVEHYLNNLMHEVRRERCDGNEQLKRDLDWFIAQETTHAQYHVRFNKRLIDGAFPELKPLIKRVTGELQSLRAKRSLAFNVAYCAGFENTATFSSRYLFERCQHLFEGADPEGANLLLWHVAEEFEHRSVCHDAFMQVSGNYFVRIAGLAYSFWHINKSFNEAATIMLAKMRQSMNAGDARASIKRHNELQRRALIYLVPRMLVLLSPWYHPSRIRLRPKTQAALEFYARQGPIERGFAAVWAEIRV